jgi:hypothetical protein
MDKVRIGWTNGDGAESVGIRSPRSQPGVNAGPLYSIADDAGEVGACARGES